MARVVLGLALALSVAVPGHAADLSPDRWPQRSELQARQTVLFPRSTREVRGSELVTATASPIAVHAGMEALGAGGSAADAAAVVALTQIATTLGGTVSYAGKLEVAYFDARSKTVSFLDAGWSPYAGERDPASIPDLGATPPAESLGRQTLVPGFMRGLEALHGRFGRLRWADLFAPSIWYAENGVTATPAIVGFLRANETRFARTPEGQKFLSSAEGATAVPKVGLTLRQPDLARTLHAVARHGATEMYSGAWALSYVAAVRAHGGRVTPQDLAGYRPAWRQPLSTTFAGATVLGMSDGPLACASLTSLNLLEAMGAPRLGPYWKDPAAFRAYARAIQYATLRQYLRPGRTGFERDAGLAASACADRLTGPYGAALATELLKPEPLPFGAAITAEPDAAHHTMAVVVVDARGNVAVLVHSSNGAPTGLVVGGVPIPEAATVNKWALTGAAAGKLLPNDIAPLIALRGGRPVAAVGATGTSLMPETVRLMGELLSAHDGVAQTMAATPLLYNFTPPEPGQGLRAWPVRVPAGAYDRAFLAEVAAMGVALKEEPAARAWGDLRGTAAAALIDPSSGIATAAEVTVLDNFAESRP